MNCLVRWYCYALLLGGLGLSGCVPNGQGQSDEEKEPYFLAGKSRAIAMDYKGAIDSFEKALEANPKSAAAHFELAVLYDRNDQKEGDPAAAIYHYEAYLKLRPRAENSEIVRQHVMACKQELARTVSLGPVTERQQRELEKLAEENKKLLEESKRLAEENKRLADETEKWRAYYAANRAAAQQPNPPAVVRASGGQTNPPAPAPVQPRPVSSISGPGSAPLTLSAPNPVSPSRGSATPSAPATRTHTVKPGETPAIIARKYGVKLESFMAANPKLDPRKLRPGQTLNVPEH